MNKIIVQNCPACEPVNRVIEELLENGYEIIEEKLEDYHFRQLYFKVNANMQAVDNLNITGFAKKDNFLICDCHWSRIEFENTHV